MIDKHKGVLAYILKICLQTLKWKEGKMDKFLDSSDGGDGEYRENQYSLEVWGSKINLIWWTIECRRWGRGHSSKSKSVILGYRTGWKALALMEVCHWKRSGEEDLYLFMLYWVLASLVLTSQLSRRLELERDQLSNLGYNIFIFCSNNKYYLQELRTANFYTF